MGKCLYSVIAFFSLLYKSLRFWFHLQMEKRKYGSYEFPYREEMNSHRVYVLANGPSLKNEIQELVTQKDFQSSIKCVTNFFGNSDLFCQFQPAYYILADPKFFLGRQFEKEYKLISHINEVVTWPMTIFVVNWGEALAKQIITNPLIAIKSTTVLQFEGFEGKRYENYKSGKAVPSYVNVLMMAEYVLLNMGFKDIRLYGVDHTFFDGMAVNDQNHVCLLEKHYYGEKLVEKMDSHGHYYTIAEWIMDKYLTFKEHENLRGYADYLGAQIINCTKNSLIDAYVRLSQIEKQNQIDKQ